MYSVVLANIDFAGYSRARAQGAILRVLSLNGVRPLGSLWSLSGRIPSARLIIQFVLVLEVSHVF
jgi:hypothetical protein